MLPESELTPEQIAQRRIIEEQYGDSTQQYYKDRLIMIGSFEAIIRDKPSGATQQDLENIKLSQQGFIQQCRKLGIRVDLDKLYEEEKKYQEDKSANDHPKQYKNDDAAYALTDLVIASLQNAQPDELVTHLIDQMKAYKITKAGPSLRAIMHIRSLIEMHGVDPDELIEKRKNEEE